MSKRTVWSNVRKTAGTTTLFPPTDDVFNASTEKPVLASDRYDLGDAITRGGIGVIYRATDRELRREVAVKVLRSKYLNDAVVARAFINEARIVSALAHPGVPPVYGCGECEDGRPYHAMKLIDGVTLADLLADPTSSTVFLLQIFADICHTIAFAHSRHLLHLDLKPANIMVGAFGEVYVMDWGMARFADGSEATICRDPSSTTGSLVAAGVSRSSDCRVLGTPDYMSPEQARGRRVDARADVFGLGGILCEILIGHAPYCGETVHDIHDQAKRGDLHSTLEGLDECDIDRALVRLVRQCLAIQRRDRPRSAIDVAKVIADYQQAALQRVERDMNRFFELSLDLFCIAGVDGYFRRINANFSRVLGYSEAELLERPFIDFVHEDDRESTIQQVQVLSDGQPVVRFQNRYRAATGDYLVLEWTAKSVEKEGIVFAVARNLTPLTE